MTSVLRTRPSLGEAPNGTFPAVERSRLANGLTVLSCHLPGKRLATVSAFVDLSADDDPAGREGVAVITARSLLEGTQQRDALALSAALEREGASLDVTADLDGLNTVLEVPGERLSALLPLLAEALREPAFPEKEVQRIVRERLEEIEMERALPATRAALEFSRVAHPAGLRAALPVGGTSTSVGAIERDDIALAHRSCFVPSTTTVIVVGDLTELDADELVEQCFGDWIPTGTRSSQPTSADSSLRRATVIDRPGSASTQFVLGHQTPGRNHSDWPAMTIAAHVLGSPLTSRLDAVLRQEKGYTYGIRASVGADRSGGLFQISSAVEASVTAPALEDLDDIVREAVAQGLTEQECSDAASYLTGVAPMSWQTSRAVAAVLTTCVANDLPTIWPSEQLDLLRSASAASVSAAVAEHVRPDEMSIAVVGDASVVTPALVELGYTEIDVQDC